MTRAEIIARAIQKPFAEIYGGCMKPGFVDRPNECDDTDCWCVETFRQAGAEAMIEESGK